MKLRFPHPLILMAGCIILAAILTHVLPAGKYDRRDDALTGKSVVIAGSYKHVDPHPIGFFAMLVAIPRGMLSAGSVIFFVILVGGAFTVVDKTGALQTLIDALVAKLGGRALLVIPIVAIAFALGGVMENMQEEILAFVPLLMLLMRRLGFRPLVGVALSFGSAAIGAAFSPINPFQVGIAQKVAGLPLLSGWQFRLALLVPALALWIAWTMRWAARHRVSAEMSERAAAPVPAEMPKRASVEDHIRAAARERVSAEEHDRAAADRVSAEYDGRAVARDSAWRHVVVVALVAGAFVLLVVGISRWDWDFDQLSGLFFMMGVAAGIVGGLGLEGTAESFVDGFRGMAYAAMLIGFARAIFVVMDDGRVVDTVVNALFTPLSHLPVAASALAMIGAHTVIHVPVPSVSGQAVLTMPLLVPLSDLLGLSRQVTILAYQTGAGLCELVTPTNGALMAMIAAAGVKYDEWLRFLAPIYAVLLVLGAGAILTAIAIGLK